jgi:hypothetical protein
MTLVSREPVYRGESSPLETTSSITVMHHLHYSEDVSEPARCVCVCVVRACVRVGETYASVSAVKVLMS